MSEEPTQNLPQTFEERVLAEFAALRQEFAAQREMITQLNTRMTSLEGRMTSLEGRMTSLEGRMTSLEDRVLSIDVRLISLEDKVDARLRETGPLPNDEDRPKKKGLATKKGAQKYDCEKIAEALQKLDDEEDLLRVIQLINENKSAETYIKSDVEGESFYRVPLPSFACLPSPRPCANVGFLR